MDINNKKKLSQPRTTCRICNNKDLYPILDLGYTPLADLFIKDLYKPEKVFALRLAVCKKCFLVQLMDDVDDDLLFGDNYAFYTGGSPSSLLYFREYADSVLKRFPKQAKNFTLEIASNDGTLLQYFKEAHCKILGIDPARNVAELANQQGIETIANFFNQQTAKKVSREKGKAGIILANNVIAHVISPNKFIKGVKEVLAPDGVFIFECQYFPYLLFNNQFDNVYHEHRSFFSFSPLVYLLRENDLKVIDIEEHDTQGGSIRVFVTHKENKIQVSESVAKTLSKEINIGMTNLDTYTGFSSRVNYIKVKLVSMLSELKAQGKTIAGYGASAKSNTLLNFCGIDTKYLDYILDKTPYKFGMYTPGTHIPVIEKAGKLPDYYLLLVWNYATGILKREKAYQDAGGKFIIPIPTPHIV